MINRTIIFYNVFVFLLLSFQVPAFALTDPTRSLVAEDGYIPVQGVIVRKEAKVVFLSGELVAEGDQTIYGEMKKITLDDVSFNQNSKIVKQSLLTDVKKEKLD